MNIYKVIKNRTIEKLFPKNRIGEKKMMRQTLLCVVGILVAVGMVSLLIYSFAKQQAETTSSSSESISSEIDAETQGYAFHFENIQVGSRVGDFIVTSIEPINPDLELNENNVEINFSGEIEISGSYIDDEWEGFGLGAPPFFYVDTSKYDLPHFEFLDVGRFTFERENLDTFELPHVERLDMSVVISSYTIRSLPSEVWDTAHLDRVLNYSVPFPYFSNTYSMKISLSSPCSYRTFGEGYWLDWLITQNCELESADGVSFDGFRVASRDSIEAYVESKQGSQLCFDGPATCEDYDWTQLISDFDQQLNLLSQKIGSETYEFITINGIDYLVYNENIPIEWRTERTFVTFHNGYRLEFYGGWFSGKGNDFQINEESEQSSYSADLLMQNITLEKLSQ